MEQQKESTLNQKGLHIKKKILGTSYYHKSGNSTPNRNEKSKGQLNLDYLMGIG